MSKLGIIALFLFALTAFVNPSLADEKKDHGFYVAPEVGYVLPTNDDVDDTVFVGGRVGYDFDRNWDLDIESGWMEYGFDVSEQEGPDITSVPILLNLRYTGRCEGQELAWYVFGGAGAVINDLESNRLGAEVDDSFGWQGGLGVDYRVAEKTSLFLDARYLWNKPDVSFDDSTRLENVEDEADLQTVMFITGVKF